MNETQARAKMEADITACIESKVTMMKLMKVYDVMGFDPINLEGKKGQFEVGQDFRDDWANNVSLVDLAKKNGVTKSCISRWARMAGLPKRKGGRKCTVRASNAFRAAWNAGISTEKMAAALGVSTNAVLNAAKADGLPNRKIGNPAFYQSKAA
jgi:hypothetical protein